MLRFSFACVHLFCFQKINQICQPKSEIFRESFTLCNRRSRKIGRVGLERYVRGRRNAWGWKSVRGNRRSRPIFSFKFLGSMEIKTCGNRLWRLPQLFFMSDQIVTKRISTILFIKWFYVLFPVQILNRDFNNFWFIRYWRTLSIQSLIKYRQHFVCRRQTLKNQSKSVENTAT